MKKTSSNDRISSQDEIVKNIKNVLRGLETLKSEHNGLLSKLKTQEDEEEGQQNGDGKHEGIIFIYFPPFPTEILSSKSLSVWKAIPYPQFR